MADNLIKISELQLTDELKSADRIPIEQDGQTRSIKGAVLEQNLLNKTDARYIENSKKGQPNGVAALDGSGKVPLTQLPKIESEVATGLSGNVEFQGKGTEVDPLEGTVAIATTSKSGVVRSDGITVNVDTQGILSVVAGGKVEEGNTQPVSGNEVLNHFNRELTEKELLPLHLNVLDRGYMHYNTGVFTVSSTMSTSELIDIGDYDILFLNAYTANANSALVVEYDVNGNYLGFLERGSTANPKVWTNYQYTKRPNVRYIAVPSGRMDLPTYNLQVSTSKFGGDFIFYTKDEANDKFQEKGSTPSSAKKYGIRWQIGSSNSVCERLFDAVGLKSSNVIGNGLPSVTSDFNTIFPWSEMKPCNLVTLPNGSTNVVYDSLDRTTKNTMIEIPLFYYKRYQEDGYEYRVISDSKESGFEPHPAFVENGVVLSHIYMSAYEGVDVGGKLMSVSGKMPINNEIQSVILGKATANGHGYTMYDYRTNDAILNLMWIEFGNRNSTTVIYNGFSDMIQGSLIASRTSILTENNTNRIVLPPSNTGFPNTYERMFSGSQILICDATGLNATEAQRNIIGYRNCVSMTLLEDGNYELVFDGEPLNINTNCFVGNSPQNTGQTDVMQYKTGRTNRPKQVAESTVLPERLNSNVYRGIENLCGNAWHYFPDVTYNIGLPYQCFDITKYEFHKTDGDYIPLFSQPQIQKDNNANHWVKEISYSPLNKEVALQEKYDIDFGYKYAFGAYFYTTDVLACIVNGGGFDHRERCNIFTNRAWIVPDFKWYLYGGRLIYKNIK